MRTSLKRSAAVVGAGVLVLGVSGVAYAFWTTGGSGTGTAQTGDVVGITINQAPQTTPLYPDGPAAPLSGTFTSTNPGPVFVTQVSVAIPAAWSAQADTGKPSCTAGDFVLVQPAATGRDVPSGTAVGTWAGASIRLANTALNQDNCKNVTPPLAYTSN